MFIARKIMSAASIVGVLAAGGIATVSTAVPAEAASCKQVASGSTWGRTYRAWDCAGKVHAQLVGGAQGDSIKIVSKAAVATGAAIPKGKTTVNTNSIPGPAYAIYFKAANRKETFDVYV